MHHIYSIHGFIDTNYTVENVPKNVKIFRYHEDNMLTSARNIAIQCATKKIHEFDYFKDIFKNVKKSIENPYVKTVTLVGHSYGGYVCSMVALKMNKSPHSHKLSIYSYASIFTLNLESIPNIRMVQYYYPGDIALKCTNIDQSSIRWLPRKASNIIEAFKVHMSYDKSIKNKIKEIIRRISNASTVQASTRQRIRA